MLVLCKILRLFVYTLSDDGKYCLLYRDKLTQAIQILLSQKQKTFSEFFSALLKSTLNFAHSRKKDDPHSRCISQIIVSEKGDSINICKFVLKRSLPRKTWQKRPKTVEICKTLPLPYLFISVNIIQLEKSMLALCKILRLFVNTLTDDDKYSLLYRDNLKQPIQILLSQKQQTFSPFFSAFLKSTLNFKHSGKKDDPHSRCISQITVSEKGA